MLNDKRLAAAVQAAAKAGALKYRLRNERLDMIGEGWALMAYSEYVVGDRVWIVRTSFPLNILRIDIGKIVQIDGTSIPYLVEIQCKNFRPKIWCYEVEHVKPEKHPVIVITTDGKTTTATMRDGKTVLKTATARCGKKDAFDFNEGARVAFERLQGREPFQHGMTNPEYYNGKVVCVESKRRWWKQK